MASGVKCTDECISKYNELKLKKTCRYITYKIRDSTEIVVDEIGARDCTFTDFKNKLIQKNDTACYAVLDFESEENISNLVLILWIPECTRVRDRMLYASSFDALKSKLTGFKGFIQVNEVADLTEEHFSQNIPGCRR